MDFDEIRADLLEEANAIFKKSLEQSSASPQPLMVHLCGIPGAGKTTYAEKWIAKYHEFSLVQFDGVMEQLAGYQKDKENLGIEEAFVRWELPARAVGYHLLQALVAKRRNILFDHSAASDLHLDLIDAVKNNNNYLVEMHYLKCDPENALIRI